MSFDPPPTQTPIIPPTMKTAVITTLWLRWFTSLSTLLGGGFTGTIVTAKLTGGGANGSITFTNGVVTAQTPAT